MKAALARHAWLVIAVAASLVTLGLRAGGLLAPLEEGFAAVRDRLLQRSVESDVVIVGIDPYSLQELSRWPWPRSVHAQLLDRMREASPRRVFIDIDFSSRSTPDDDSALSAALARWHDNPVVLPAFAQRAIGGDLVLTTPIDELSRHAALASVNVRPGRDGLVHDVPGAMVIGAARLPSVVSLLQPSVTGDVAVDFSILPDSLTHYSYSAVLFGEVPAGALRDKVVYIGATAIELGDMVPVPIYHSLPGVVVQAMAYETARAGGIRVLPGWLLAAVVLAVSLAASRLFTARRWRTNVASLVVCAVLITGAAAALFSVARIELELIPVVGAVILVFLIVSFRMLEVQTLRALSYAVGMRKSHAMYNSIVNSSSDPIITLEPDGRIRAANHAANELFGDEGSIVGHRFSELLPTFAETGDVGASLEQWVGVLSEWESATLRGNEVPVELSLSRVRFDDERLFTAIVRDVTARRAHQEELEYRATHDPLTALPNRAALATALGDRLHADGSGERVALLMLDLNNFKEVNDTLGHSVGDRVLVEVAKRFDTCLDQRGFIARIGGDEFAVVLDQKNGTTHAVKVAEDLIGTLAAPLEGYEVAIDIGLSVGIAYYPDDAVTAEDLLRYADVAMFEAKRSRSGYKIYHRDDNRHSLRRLGMAGQLRKAIASNELELHYQPQVQLSTNRVESVEALLRWHQPQLGNVSPDEFVTLAEGTDLIRPLTEWTLTEAVDEALSWQQRGERMRIAINLSARILQDEHFPGRLGTLLESRGVEPARIELEITECAMMIDPARARRIMDALHELGVFLAIDDFGTGYSSLSYLRDLPAHALKLDKSFVMSMRENRDDRVIVESTVQMAQGLDLEVVAEGVETAWDERFLRRLGCNLAQGYHYSRALPGDQCQAWIEAFHAKPAAKRRRRKKRVA